MPMVVGCSVAQVSTAQALRNKQYFSRAQLRSLWLHTPHAVSRFSSVPPLLVSRTTQPRDTRRAELSRLQDGYSELLDGERSPVASMGMALHRVQGVLRAIGVLPDLSARHTCCPAPPSRRGPISAEYARHIRVPAYSVSDGGVVFRGGGQRRKESSRGLAGVPGLCSGGEGEVERELTRTEESEKDTFPLL